MGKWFCTVVLPFLQVKERLRLGLRSLKCISTAHAHLRFHWDHPEGPGFGQHREHGFVGVTVSTDCFYFFFFLLAKWH